MKQIVFCVMLLCAGYLCWADEAEKSFVRIAALLDSGIDKNYLLIQQESLNLSPSQRIDIVEWNLKSVTLPLLLNATVGFGSGSFVLGDNTWGLISLVGQIFGLGSIFLGDIMSRNSGETSFLSVTGDALAPTGMFIFAAFRIFDCIRPFIFAHQYNTKLMNLFHYSELVVAPSVNRYGNPQILLALTYRF
ncbi:hypothetical protein FACS1894172_05340 [Spirochaetia bacterium]|nr:hypothetical protein FACS1894164_05600 [Spirochaetia bacterium]GHU31061.1 hypothetical protein FACS1894172_05340 [Spirochaetia bacterium]